jgi:Grx4 family monothiol glutaredoxin
MLKNGAVVDTLKGANPPELTRRVAALVQAHGSSSSAVAPSVPTEDKKASLHKRLADLIASHKVMAFIKGTPDAPQCGFSNKFVQILRKNNVEFGSFDILSDADVRQGLKEFSNWPTYPQLYANAKLVGGFDIVKELDAEGELVSSLEAQ